MKMVRSGHKYCRNATGILDLRNWWRDGRDGYRMSEQMSLLRLLQRSNIHSHPFMPAKTWTKVFLRQHRLGLTLQFMFNSLIQNTFLPNPVTVNKPNECLRKISFKKCQQNFQLADNFRSWESRQRLSSTRVHLLLRKEFFFLHLLW